jgi:hypothetical protein
MYISTFLVVTFVCLSVANSVVISLINVDLMVDTGFQLFNTHSIKAVFTAIKNHFAQIAVTKYQFNLPTSVA